MLQTLKNAATGHTYTVAGLSCTGKKLTRLCQLGITPGTEIKLTGKAPFGDPLKLSLRGYTLSLRKDAAECIAVACDTPENRTLYDRDDRFAITRNRNPVTYTAKGIKTAVLCGNPNCGKTTLFNALTGSVQYVGNWPGVTAVKACGQLKTGQKTHKPAMVLTDLPGTYSLTPCSPEERVTSSFIYTEDPGLIINVADACQLERSLYLTTELTETGKPVILVLNMYDALKSAGKIIDTEKLSDILGIPVFAVSSKTGEGIDRLISALTHTEGLLFKKSGLSAADFLPPKEKERLKKAKALIKRYSVTSGLNAAHIALKALEHDGEALFTQGLPHTVTKALAQSFGNEKSDKPAAAAARYKMTDAIVRGCTSTVKRHRGQSITERLDGILTGCYTALPVLAAALFLMFNLTFSKNLLFTGVTSPGEVLHGLLNDLFEYLSSACKNIFEGFNVSPWLSSLVCDGIIGAVGAVLSYSPQIMLLYLFLSFFEASGYMARIAYILDYPASLAGFTGKAFLPLFMGFGCSVPAVTSCSILPSRHDKTITALVIPFMSCGAKMPIYIMVTSMLFKDSADTVIILLYLVGAAVAAITCCIIKKFTVYESRATFIMELPSYRMPDARSISRRLVSKLKDFVVRAGTVLAAASVIIWLLSHLSLRLTPVLNPSEPTVLSELCRVLRCIFLPLGFASGEDGWKAVVAVISGLAAKETVVSVSAMLGFMPGDIPSALSFLVFNLLTVPCIAALTAVKHAVKSLKLFLLCLVYWFAVSWLMSFAVYNIAGVFY